MDEACNGGQLLEPDDTAGSKASKVMRSRGMRWQVQLVISALDSLSVACLAYTLSYVGCARSHPRSHIRAR